MLRTHSFMSVRPRREALGIAARDMAHHLGITTATFYRYERGDARPFFDQAIAIAKLLNCEPSDLARDLTLQERVQFIAPAPAAAIADDDIDIRFPGGVDEEPE